MDASSRRHVALGWSLSYWWAWPFIVLSPLAGSHPSVLMRRLRCVAACGTRGSGMDMVVEGRDIPNSYCSSLVLLRRDAMEASVCSEH